MNVEAAAILRAYSERAVPLPVQEAAEWYAPGGRYWRLVWAVCGYVSEGDKMHAAESLWWVSPISPSLAAEFWPTLEELAAQSDAWQLRQGIDTSPPKIDTQALLSRSVPWTDAFLSLRPAPIWDRFSSKPTTLMAFIKEAYGKLKEWRKRRSATPLPLPLPGRKSDGGGLTLILLGVAALVLSGGGRRTTSRRSRRR